MKSLQLFFCRCCMLIFCCTGLSQVAHAQTDADALMIPKNFFCAAAMYNHDSWDHYWEGTFKRTNGNLGTVSSNTYVLGGNYGITNKLDVLFSVPYITTNASAGTLQGQKGFQDLTLTLKWLAFQTEIGKGIFTLHAIGSGTLPLSSYDPNFLPVSIGLHSPSVALRALVNYQTGRFFVAGAGQYVRRDNITINQDAYYTSPYQLTYSNQVYMPNVTNFLFSTGYRSLKLNVEATLTQMTTKGGFDIVKNGLPFPGNRMNATMAGGLVKYSLDALTGLEFTAGGNYVVAGRNVGQSTNFFGSVFYVFDLSKKKATTK